MEGVRIGGCVRERKTGSEHATYVARGQIAIASRFAERRFAGSIDLRCKSLFHKRLRISARFRMLTRLAARSLDF
jgi:hypothetical protein